MLFDAFDLLAGKDDIRIFPRYEDRVAWQAADSRLAAFFRRRGQDLLAQTQPWQPLTIEQYTQFSRTGNRSQYEDMYFERRFDLVAAVICACLDGAEQYLEYIRNALLCLCDEISWCLPAHNPYAAHPAPDDLPTVDLFAADTGATVAVTLYLLGDRLRKAYPADMSRIERELNARVKTPYILRNDFWWLCIDENVKPCNWSSWISADMLLTFACTSSAEEMRACAQKATYTLQKLYDALPADGECDEGVGYWNVSAAAIFNAAEILQAATKGKWKPRFDAKFSAMARFAYNMHIAGGQYVNFGDCALVPQLDYPTAFRFAQAANDGDVADFAAARFDERTPNYVFTGKGHSTELLMYRAVSALFIRMPRIKSGANGDSTFYERTAILTAHNENGFFFAAKGRGDSGGHTHIDAGSGIVYYKNAPVVIDIGHARYTADSFSQKRKELWFVRSAYHNTICVDRTEQQENGGAVTVLDAVTGKNACLRLDMTGAYKNARLGHYERTWKAVQDGVDVTDDLQFVTDGTTVYIYWLTCIPPKCECGDIAIGNVVLQTIADSAYSVQIEEIPLSDPKLVEFWGKSVYRIVLRFDSLRSSLKVTAKFRSKQ